MTIHNTDEISISRTDRPALILVDIQKGFNNVDYWGGQRNNPDAEKKSSELLQLWRKHDLPIFHIKHCSTIPTSLLNEANEGNDFQELVKPVDKEPILRKNVNSAFIGTNLKEQLDKLKIKKIVIVGLTTDHCISTTTRMGANLGFDTFVVSDATATFNRKGPEGQNYTAELIHVTALASLNDEFAKIVTSEFLKQRI